MTDDRWRMKQTLNVQRRTPNIEWKSGRQMSVELSARCAAQRPGDGSNVFGHGAVSAGIGLYFIGKAFFVGPMLLITALKT